jgi:hypothetical protein
LVRSDLHVGAVAQPGFDLFSQAGLLQLIDVLEGVVGRAGCSGMMASC